MGWVKLLLIAMVFCLFLNFVNAESIINVYQATDKETPEISTGQTDEWYYLKLATSQQTDYIGINKLSRGIMGVGDKNEFYGEIWLVPAFRHPVNSNWYLCPIRDVSTVHEVKNLGNGWWFNISDSALTCYQYDDITTTANANVDVQLSFIGQGSIVKTNINTTVNGVNPTNTGFAYIFFPENPAKYRYVMLNGQIYDLAGVEGQLPADKVFEFLDSGQDPIGHTFDWTDMLDVGNRYAEILTVGGKKGLMVGTYGYGASNRIEIDPVYNFTVSAGNPSWHLLNGNFTTSISTEDYDSKVNITAGISDGSDATYYKVRLGVPLFSDYLNYYFPMNEIDSSYGLNDMSPNKDELTILPDANMGLGNNIRTLNTDVTIIGGAKGIYKNFYNIGYNDFTYCVKVNGSTQSGTDYILSHQISSMIITVPNYAVAINNADNPVCYARDNNDTGFSNPSATGTTDVVDGQTHSICCRADISNANFSIFVDGTHEASHIGNIDYNVSNYGDLVINGRGTTQANQFQGMVDEVVLWSRLMTEQDMSYYSQVGAYNQSQANSIQVFFNRQINISKNYNLKVTLISNGYDTYPFRVYSCLNSTHINDTSYVEKDLSMGLNYISLDGIVNEAYNEPFRLSTLYPANATVSEIYLVEVGNDTTPPVIFDCYVNDSFVDCNESVTWGCHITDDSDVSEAYGRVSVVGTNYTITHEAFRNPTDPEKWDVVLSSSDILALFQAINWSFDSYLNISLDYVNATDLSGNTKENSSFDVWNIYGCIICTPNWVADFGACLTNDSKLKYYNDTNNCNNSFGLPGDNGTYVSCNYCSEDLVADDSACYLLNSSFVKNRTYTDNNYFSCCVLTSLPSDCSILSSPYNETTVIACNVSLDEDFELTVDLQAFFGFGIGGLASDKVYGKIWINDTNTTYYCLTYVETINGNLLQVNPPYTQRTTGGILQLMAKEIEPREFFVTQNGLANVYWTDNNLVIDGRQYIFGVECSGNNQQLRSEKLTEAFYEPVNAPITRWFWFKDNVFSIVLFGFMALFILFIVAYTIQRLRKG